MPGSRLTTVGAAGGGDLGAAAQEIANGAKALARWSKKIPPSITVDVAGNTATITAPVEPGYAAETRARHPLFGNRRHWYGPPGEPFLGPALDQRAGAAMARYAKKIDRMLRDRGFK